MNDKKRKLSRMVTWTVAVFATVFAVTAAVMWLVYFPTTAGSSWNVLGAVLKAGWPIFVIDLVLCIGVYFGYKLYLDRKK
jgi:hypothetical protein